MSNLDILRQIWYYIKNEGSDCLNVKRLYVFVYAIVAFIFTIYVVSSPIASVSESPILKTLENEYWFGIADIPYGGILKIIVFSASITMIFWAAISILKDKDSYLISGFAMSALLYTLSSLAINLSIDSYASKSNLVVSEYGVAWHMLLIIMAVNTFHLGFSLIFLRKNKNYD